MAENEKHVAYRYSADEQREWDAFRGEYELDFEQDALMTMRKTDAQALSRASRRTIGLGIISLLMFGGGLSMVLSLRLMLPGILVGCVGIGLMAAMPAIHARLLRRARKNAASKRSERISKPRDKK